MNKEKALEQFIKEEYDFLLSSNFSVQKLRKVFSERYSDQFGRVDSRDVVVPLVTYLAKQQIPAENIQKYITSLPVFRGLTRALELKLSSLARRTDHTSGLKPEDKELLSQLDALEAAK